MIEVVYYRDKHKVTVTGHANAAPHGEDLVCAAASILIQTLAQHVDRLSTEHGICRRPHITVKPGNAVVSVSAVHGFDKTLTLIFDTVCVGFELLAVNEPKFITYKIV